MKGLEVYLSALVGGIVGIVGAVLGAIIAGKVAGREQRKTEVYKMKRKALAELQGHITTLYLDFMQFFTDYTDSEYEFIQELPNIEVIEHLKQLKKTAEKHCKYCDYWEYSEHVGDELPQFAQKLFQKIENKQVPSPKELYQMDQTMHLFLKSVLEDIESVELTFNPSATGLWVQIKQKIRWKVNQILQNSSVKIISTLSAFLISISAIIFSYDNSISLLQKGGIKGWEIYGYLLIFGGVFLISIINILDLYIKGQKPSIWLFIGFLMGGAFFAWANLSQETTVNTIVLNIFLGTSITLGGLLGLKIAIDNTKEVQHRKQ